LLLLLEVLLDVDGQRGGNGQRQDHDRVPVRIHGDLSLLLLLLFDR
jgi:hypothetical protein